MIIIAEISDKMASVPKLWAIMAVFAAPFLIGAMRRWVAWVLLPLAIVLSGWIGYEAYQEAFVEAGMKEAIREEMGWWWIINSLSSTMLPALVAVGVLAWQLQKKRISNKASHATSEPAPGTATSSHGG